MQKYKYKAQLYANGWRWRMQHYKRSKGVCHLSQYLFISSHFIFFSHPILKLQYKHFCNTRLTNLNTAENCRHCWIYSTFHLYMDHYDGKHSTTRYYYIGAGTHWLVTCYFILGMVKEGVCLPSQGIPYTAWYRALKPSTAPMLLLMKVTYMLRPVEVCDLALLPDMEAMIWLLLDGPSCTVTWSGNGTLKLRKLSFTFWKEK